MDGIVTRERVRGGSTVPYDGCTAPESTQNVCLLPHRIAPHPKPIPSHATRSTPPPAAAAAAAVAMLPLLSPASALSSRRARLSRSYVHIHHITTTAGPSPCPSGHHQPAIPPPGHHHHPAHNHQAPQAEPGMTVTLETVISLRIHV